MRMKMITCDPIFIIYFGQRHYNVANFWKNIKCTRSKPEINRKGGKHNRELSSNITFQIDRLSESIFIQRRKMKNKCEMKYMRMCYSTVLTTKFNASNEICLGFWQTKLQNSHSQRHVCGVCSLVRCSMSVYCFTFYLLRATVFCFYRSSSRHKITIYTQQWRKVWCGFEVFVTHSERCWWCHNSNPLRGMFVFCIFDSVCLFFQRPFENCFFFSLFLCFSSTVVQITYVCRTNT